MSNNNVYEDDVFVYEYFFGPGYSVAFTDGVVISFRLLGFTDDEYTQ